MRTFRRIVKFILYFHLALLLVLSISIVSVYRFSKLDQTRKCDAAIILGTAVWKDKPSPVFEERIKHGIWLYQQGYVKYLIFTGGKADGDRWSEAYTGKQYAIEHGVPPQDIFIEDKSTVTEENIRFSCDILNRESIDTVLVVSDPSHMRRALYICNRYKLHAYSSPTRTTRFRSFGPSTGFLLWESLMYSGMRVRDLFR